MLLLADKNNRANVTFTTYPSNDKTGGIKLYQFRRFAVMPFILCSAESSTYALPGKALLYPVMNDPFALGQCGFQQVFQRRQTDIIPD